MSVYQITERKICWPLPDATCLHGGCTWCQDGQWKTLAQLHRYAAKAGVLLHRGLGEQDAVVALDYGIANQFFGRVPVRTDKAALEAWTKAAPVLALKKMAEGMPHLHESRKSEVVAWLLRYRRDVLEESYRRSSTVTREGS